jgi:hypothetical protein
VGCFQGGFQGFPGQLRCGLILVRSAKIPGSFGVMNDLGPKIDVWASFQFVSASQKTGVIWVNLNRSSAALATAQFNPRCSLAFMIEGDDRG